MPFNHHYQRELSVLLKPSKRFAGRYPALAPTPDGTP